MLALRQCVRWCHSLVDKPPLVSKTFQSLGVNDFLVERLSKLKITVPTPIQCKIIPRVLRGYNVVFADQTGSGKTLCYLLPIIQRCLAAKAQIHLQAAESGSQRLGVRGVVLVPSAILAEQVAEVFNTLVGEDGIQAHAVHRQSQLRIASETGLLVLTVPEAVAYPSDVWQDVETVVYDEADCLTLPHIRVLFREVHKLFLKNARKSKITGGNEVDENVPSDGKSDVSGWTALPCVTPQNRQFIALSATVAKTSGPLDIFPYVRMSKRPLVTVYPKSAYRLPDSATCKFRYYESVDEKKRLLLQCLQDLVPRGKTVIPLKECPRVIVFVHQVNLEEVQMTLNSVKPPPPPMVDDKSIKKASACQIYSSCWWHNRVVYSGSVSDLEDKDTQTPLADFISGRHSLLVSIRRESRGVDYPDVSAVIMYDLPNAIEFLHYAGRTARAGAKGHVFCFMSHRKATRAQEDISDCLHKDEHMQLKHLLQERRARAALLFRKKRVLQSASKDILLEKEVEEFGQALKKLAMAGEDGVEDWGDIADEDIPFFRSNLGMKPSRNSTQEGV